MDKPVNAKEDIIEIRDILCIRKPGQIGYQNYRQVLRKVNNMMEDNQQLTRTAFATVIHHLFPEIMDVKKFSPEGQTLIDDALNCLFNAFDTNQSGRISYKKLNHGLDILCDMEAESMFERGSNVDNMGLTNELAGMPASAQDLKPEKKEKKPMVKQALPAANEITKSGGQPDRREKDEPIAFKKKMKVTKEDREKKTAKSSMSVMEKQNALRAEAALRKKEEARQRREAAAAGGGTEKVDKVAEKEKLMKKTQLGVKAEMDKNAAQDLTDLFDDDILLDSLEDVKTLSVESCMRQVSSKAAMAAFKTYVAKGGTTPLCKEHFVDFMITIMQRYDFCDTKAEEDNLRDGFDQVFETFDYDKSGNLDSEEIANCLSMMCGGSINEKLLAAFNLFDVNSSMTLDFDQLHKFIKCFFQIFEGIKNKNIHKEGSKIWSQLDMKKLVLATTEKCFADNRVIKGKGEINYTQFMQWMTG